jgi:GTPase
MTKEHLGLALALNVPVLVVITKIDMCPPNVLESTIKQVTKVLKSSGCRKMPIFISDMEQVITTAQNFVSERYDARFQESISCHCRLCPIFQISNVNGSGLNLLRSFMNLLPASKNYDLSLPVEFQITDTFSVPGVGTVGMLVSEWTSFNQSLIF